jgi:pyruvate-ferredoxin/flavodoxin oxidoreductase
MEQFAQLTGRRYDLFEYVGSPDAEDVFVLMGSGVGAVEEAVVDLQAQGKKVGLLKVRLYRPFDGAGFIEALPATVKRLAVLDRTKEPGSIGEPLYQDVVTALSEFWCPVEKDGQAAPQVYGGRYGLSSKEFTPAMVLGVFSHLRESQPKRHFTVGIYDDVSRLSLPWDAKSSKEPADVIRAVFYGLGSDGTVGASKNSVKIIGENTDLFAQGYFVYDSKKAGSITVSHLRFSPRPINSTYLIDQATFVACHQFQFLEKIDVLATAAEGATFLLNSPYPTDTVWNELPLEVQRQIIEKKLKFYVVDGYAVSQKTGMGRRFNTAMQSCFFALAGLLPKEEAIEKMKEAVRDTYGKRGETIVKQNFDAIDEAVVSLAEVKVPGTPDSVKRILPPVAKNDIDFINRVTAAMLAGRGDLLPVSALPVDGTFITATAKYEKRSIAQEIPIWDAAICIDCGLCALVCPHAAIRMKVYPDGELQGAPDGFKAKAWRDKEMAGHQLTIQVAPDDCTGCGVCVDVCPAKSKEVVKHKAINMEPKLDHLDRERDNWSFFLERTQLEAPQTKVDTIKGSQLLEPLFEFSGACAGCGETPYLKLMSQLFGDRAIIANATGCSSIYGGNLPTTPYTTNSLGRGPAWCNSLFEDNGEFGLGIRLAVDAQLTYAEQSLRQLSPWLDTGLVEVLINPQRRAELPLAELRKYVDRLKAVLPTVDDPIAAELLTVADALIPRSVWIVGGDGWAYDIGFGGLDHVLSCGRDVNILVLDTGVYSNTGGQASKATPRAAIAKFAAKGKATRKKDLGMLAVSYGHVYVAQVALGANPNQTLKAFHEAESYHGTSLILAYSQCIAHGINMTTGMSHQKDVVQTGLWPLFRYDPRLASGEEHAFRLDSRKPTMRFADFVQLEARFAMAARTDPAGAQKLFELAQKDIDDQWHYYEQMAGFERDITGADGDTRA